MSASISAGVSVNASTNLSAIEGAALSAVASGARAVSMLAPVGAIGAAVGDILSAAGDVVDFVNTAEAALASFISPINDPIRVAFSVGQPHGGVFITAPTVTNVVPVNFSASLSISTSLVSRFSAAQLLALAARVAVGEFIGPISISAGISITTDAELSIAMALMFSQIQVNLKLGFSIDISDDSIILPLVASESLSFTVTTNGITTTTATSETITPTSVTIITSGLSNTNGTTVSVSNTTISTTTSNYYQTTNTTVVFTTVVIPPISLSPNVAALSAFVAGIAGSFPNIPGIEGVAASIWTDNLNTSTGDSGSPITGVPSNIPSGVYNDITTITNNIISVSPITVVDYSYQQNQFNLIVALSIDNSLGTTLASLLGSSLVTSTTTKIIKNRLKSVAQRGDVVMLNTLITLLGQTGIPDPTSLLITLLTNLNPSDQPIRTATKTIASGITITTTTTPLTTAQMIASLNTILASLNMTIQELCCLNTCNSIFCSQSLLNVPFIKSMNRAVLEGLLGTEPVDMAYMFT